MTKKILLVEDNPNNMRLIKQLMEDIDESIELICADCGKTALQLAADTSFKLVLMDISLPDMNGITVTNKLKEYPQLKETPFIAVTAYAISQDEESFRKTFDDYISKPIDDDIFTDKINHWIQG